jgi:hypothetical protein
LLAEECDDDLAERIRRKLIKAAHLSDCPSQALFVEKTVSNCLRVDFVDKIFPKARYIHIVRDGRAVVESAHRQWIGRPDLRYLMQKIRSVPLANTSYLLRYAAGVARNIVGRRAGGPSWGPRYSGIDEDLEVMSLHEVCAIQWVRCVERAGCALDRLNTERVLTTRYEDLTTGAGEIERICDFLELARPQSVMDAFSATVQAHHVDKWRSGLDVAQQRLVMPLLSEQLQRHGYE